MVWDYYLHIILVLRGYIILFPPKEKFLSPRGKVSFSHYKSLFQGLVLKFQALVFIIQALEYKNQGLEYKIQCLKYKKIVG